MQHMTDPNRPADPSGDAAARPPQSDRDPWALGRIFADSHQKVLEDCAAAADESDRTERREGLASNVHSLMRQMNLTGTTVTRAPPDASRAGARPDAPDGCAASRKPGSRFGAAPPAPQAQDHEECVVIIDDDDACADVEPEASNSGGAQAAPLRTASAQAQAQAQPRDMPRCNGRWRISRYGSCMDTGDGPHDGPAAGGGTPHHAAWPMPSGGLDAVEGCDWPGADAEAGRRDVGGDADLDADGARRESRCEDGVDTGPDCGFAEAAEPDEDWSAAEGEGFFDDKWEDPPDGLEPDFADDDLAGSDAGQGACRDEGRRKRRPRIGRWLAAAVLVAAAAGAAMLWIGGSGGGRLAERDSSLPAAPDSAPDGGVGEIRRMVTDAIESASGEAAPPSDAGWSRRQGGAEDLRGMIADALDEGRAPDGAGAARFESAHDGGADVPEGEIAAAANPIGPADARFARIERRLGDAERGAVSMGGLIGALSAAIADSAAQMEAIERSRAAMESQLADLVRRAAEAGRAEGRAAGLRARLDETDSVVLDLAARVATLEAEADAGGVAMIDGEGGADAPGWLNDWGPDPFAADGPRTQWENSVDDNPVYRRIPAAARLVRDQDGRIVPVFVETPAAVAPQGG